MENCRIIVKNDGILKINDNDWIEPDTVICANKSIEIGKNSRIAHNCSLVDNNYNCEIAIDDPKYFILTHLR